VVSTASLYLHAAVENLTLAGAALFGVGNAEANLITGNGLANLIIGWAGADTLLGQEGNDRVFGGIGDDRIELGAGIDEAVAGDGADTILGGEGADRVFGEAGDDLILGGTDFATDILLGGADNDTIDGGLAWDLMYGGTGNDVFHASQQVDWVFENPDEGHDTVIADSPNGYYLYANVEDLVLVGSTPFGVGNALGNRITGNASGNTLLGGGGNDTLNGGGGFDILWGQAGADVFELRAGTGSDVIADFVRGEDRIDIAQLGLATLAEVTARMIQGGAHVRLDLGGSDFVVIHNQTIASFTLADFILA
jgi:Ca2+-binding RTX toxin-like protein